MSSTHLNPPIHLAEPAVHHAGTRDLDEPKRDLTKADEIHHLYFEDNDGFFPPAWLGKDTSHSERRASNDSTTSHGPKD